MVLLPRNTTKLPALRAGMDEPSYGTIYEDKWRYIQIRVTFFIIPYVIAIL